MKNKFIKSTIILIIGGCLTKIVGLLTRIITTRVIGIEGISLFSMINPTYSLLITIANFNILISTSKRISSKINSRKVIINSCYLMFLLNVILISIIFLEAKYISNNLLNNKATYYPLIACSITLPFISLGYIIKGYFYGKQNMTPHMISNVLEQLFRLAIISLILPKITKYGTIITITTLILFNILSESFSIIILLIFLPKNITIKKEDLKFDLNESKALLNISLPTVAGRIIGNIGFFFEPIILTNILLSQGLNISYITKEYGVYNSYVISTLLFPSFFINAISNSLLPEISKYYAQKNLYLVKKRIKQAIIFSLTIGLICSTAIFISSPLILKILYNTNEGIEYLKILTPFFILYYLESPLCSILIALNKTKTCTLISTSSILIKLIIMTILCLLNFKILSLIIAEIISIFYSTILYIIKTKKSINHFS